ncbi:MAG TPA: glycosyltransferase [Phycisphaerales bacterium]|nr:glycosyltransferase [Phycisphaerales bacterium]
MRVLILADEFFASRERGLLTRLEIGLADEGVRVIHAVPEGTPTDSSEGVFSRVLTYSSKTLLLTRPLAVRKLVRAVAEMDSTTEATGIDVVHVFGGSVWHLGADLASEIGAGLALEVWRSGLVDRAKTIHLDDDAPLFIAPDQAIERALLKVPAGGEHPAVRLAAWGVHTPSTAREILTEGRAPSIMLVGSGRDEQAFRTAIEGIAAIARERPDLLIFCDALAARRTDAWALARKLGILHNLSLIDELEGRRDLLLYGDILVQPEAHGEQRSILLEAMATGMVVVAGADPMVSILQDGLTARLVKRPMAAEWSAVLRDVVTSPERARALSKTAREHVKTARRASDHVRAVLSAYDWLSSDEPLPLP